jgi:hypothetical protein
MYLFKGQRGSDGYWRVSWKENEAFLKRKNRTDQSGRIENGGPRVQFTNPALLEYRVGTYVLPGRVYFLLLKKKKNWCITLLYVITDVHVWVVGRLHALRPVCGIMKDAIWDRNYLLSSKRLHQVQFYRSPHYLSVIDNYILQHEGTSESLIPRHIVFLSIVEAGGIVVTYNRSLLLKVALKYLIGIYIFII